ncbi:hypothetical protein [Halorhodospira halochloris]|uniref:hypothetical protein n=1 Tax=Halorhodospira halochloris TaxID=1052 RepID=UPI001E5E3362|nr:hypothetical protein [Halorhodospira halochloris]
MLVRWRPPGFAALFVVDRVGEPFRESTVITVSPFMSAAVQQQGINIRRQCVDEVRP